MSFNAPALSVRGLSKSYTIAHNGARDTTLGEAIVGSLKNAGKRSASTETFWALQDVSFDIAKGDVVGIIGRNGAGKSTLLKILSRITEPTAGQIDLYGRVGSLLEVGTGFHPELTGRENIFLNGAILGMGRREIASQFDAIVDFSGTEQFLDTPVKRYSSGMYVRLAFAVAAHLNPEILIVDEVLAVGDAEFQKKCLGKMQDVAKGGRTILFVSHNMGAVRSLCRRAIWLSSGRVYQDGSAADVVDSYLQNTLDDASVALDLTGKERAHSTADKLRITGIEFNRGTPLRHGEPLLARIQYETFDDVYGVSFGFGFATLEGTRLMSLDSDLADGRRDIPARRQGVIELRLEKLLLQPGRYSLDVGSRSGNQNSLDFMSACAQIEVMPGPDTPGMIIRDDGGVRMPGSWRWLDAHDNEADGAALAFSGAHS